MSEPIKLTQYSHGAGCGCKISPKVLETILSKSTDKTFFPSLLVGNHTNDDAAVYDLGNGTAIISTTDFFMPIVDDPFDFGGIASVNAISDVYAMGGTPIMAIAILGWPIDKLAPEVANQVLNGSRKACEEAGIPLAGGHSIDAPEPIFGLAVTGTIPVTNVKKNSTATAGSYLYLTKPLGIGIITTAQKRGIVTEEHLAAAKKSMLTLNKLGAKLGNLPYVSAVTDVTGFGLLGHLAEVCESSGVSATIDFDKVPKFDFLDLYLNQKSIPGGTVRNWESYGHKIGDISDYQRSILADPQTSGGLLIAVDENEVLAFEDFLKIEGMQLQPFGYLSPEEEYVIRLK
ncbi:selenide, water dikinase SelD [uncultured Imperialibacter sp.]|uniref:selenide, water dikinase SelD n=1 Tax=uncultured Imperialibacter sp. TaxID=1672639 RepID=UPI0030DCDF33|tara:strand:+ start:7386 stop:8420 length:1035 start_codon:yes stop_codon:yes gene_type:complete